MKHKQKIYNGNEEMFSKLESMALTREDLKQLIEEIDSPRLTILYISLFSSKSTIVNHGQMRFIEEELYNNYCCLVDEACEKYKLDKDGQSQQKYQQVITYIKA